MKNIDLYLTEDGSIGLFNKQINDIYHSRQGAYLESYKKFILPAKLEAFCKANNEIRILDICYGIGYNTKSAIETALKINPNIKIIVDALDIDKDLIVLSGFLKSSQYDKRINQIVIENLNSNFSKLELSKILNNLKNDKDIKKYLSKEAIQYCKKIHLECSKTPLNSFLLFLHNIYYEYISKRNKKSPNPFIFNDIQIYYYINDARNSIKNLKNNYDFIFLDAFTPKLNPCLWSYDFFRVLFNLLKPNGKLLTYSSAVIIRSAMMQNKFFIGKILDNNKSIGTIATKNNTLIEIPLSEYEEGLLNTKAGICYYDPDFSFTNKEILINHELACKNSNLISSSQYIKNFNKGIK